jgi:hypothetical protein
VLCELLSWLFVMKKLRNFLGLKRWRWWMHVTNKWRIFYQMINFYHILFSKFVLLKFNFFKKWNLLMWVVQNKHQNSHIRHFNLFFIMFFFIMAILTESWEEEKVIINFLNDLKVVSVTKLNNSVAIYRDKLCHEEFTNNTRNIYWPMKLSN